MDIFDPNQILPAFFLDMSHKAPANCPFAGALSIPREITLVGDRVYNFPVAEVRHLLRQDSPYVQRKGETLYLLDRYGRSVRRQIPGLDTVDILEDTKSVEIFINKGEMSFTWWLDCVSGGLE